MLDIERHDELVGYLRSTGRIDASEAARCETLAGGVSCRTVLVQRDRGPSLVVKQALEFLRVAETWRGDPARIAREAEAMRALNDILWSEQVPQLVFEDASQHLIGMTAVPRPHENWKTVLLRGEIDDRFVTEFAEILGTIHRECYLQRDEIGPRFANRSQFETLRVDPYYRFTAQQVPSVASWIDALIEDTAATRETLVHGDFSPKNVLVTRRGCVLLDHEVAHWGDPAFDIGFATAHFFGKANHLPDHRAELADAARLFWGTYRQIVEDLPWSLEMADRAVRHSIACTLARVRGKSPLEYLTAPQRERQASVALSLLREPPVDYDDLVARFVRTLGS